MEGLQRIDRDTVISYSEIDINMNYSEEKGNEIIRNLFKTNLFSNIEISFIDNKLSIRLKENPTINLIRFQGNKKKSDEDLLQELSLKERSVYSRSKVKKDIERMLSLYQRAGRLSTEIIPKVETLENNRINLTYEILESDVAKVSNIIILGNDVYKTSKLKSIMKTKEKRLLRLFSSADRYDPDKLEYDKQLLSQFYNNNGYPDFKILSSIAQLSPISNEFEIILTISEGQKFNFGNISINNELKKLNTSFIEFSLKFKEGEVFDQSKIKESVKTIKEIAELQGYSFAEIDPITKKDDENKKINIEFVVNEGPRVYVNKINISGNVRTVDKVIRREITLSEGDAYNKFSINYSKDSIRALNFSQMLT